MENVFLSTAETARMLHVAAITLRFWRRRGIGPQYYRVGPRHVRYKLTDIEAWLEQQRGAPCEK